MGRSTERLGRSGEFAVASHLALFSDTVTIVPHGSHADILFEHEDKILKCQVKTKSNERLYEKKGVARRIGWQFDLRRGRHTKDRYYGENGENSIDIYALYCMPLNIITYIPSNYPATKITLSTEQLKNTDPYESLIKSINDLSVNNFSS